MSGQKPKGGFGSRNAPKSVGGGAGQNIIDRLSALQNLIKRDPSAYRDEYKTQMVSFNAELDIHRLTVSSSSSSSYDVSSPGTISTSIQQPGERLRELVIFLAHVYSCYKDTDPDMALFPQQLMDFLDGHSQTLSNEVRRNVVQALTLLRNRGALEPAPLCRVLFALWPVKDKYLRELIVQHAVSDVIHLRRTRKDGGSAERAIQAQLYGLLTHESPVTAKKSLEVLIELHKRRVWTDSRAVNVIASALLNPRPKIFVAALKFFLGAGSGEGGDDEDSDSEDENSNNPKDAQLDGKKVLEVKDENRNAKKTRKRVKATAKHLSALKTMAKKKALANKPGGGDGLTAQAMFPAIQLINDPQGLAEKLFNRLRKTGGEHKFDVRLLMLNFVTRLVGQHRLILLQLYSFLQRYLQAHQTNVTQILAYLIQACHELVPPDELAPVVKNIARSFISDGCPPEQIQVGLNSLREIFLRQPVVLEEEGMADLISDLVLYKKAKNKGVVAGARAILNLVREWYPSLLRRKDWGKDVSMDIEKATSRPTAYGSVKAATGVDGADLLALALARKAMVMRNRASAAEEEGESDEEDEEDDGDRSSRLGRTISRPIIEADIIKIEDEDEWVRSKTKRERELLLKTTKKVKNASMMGPLSRGKSSIKAKTDEEADDFVDFVLAEDMDAGDMVEEDNNDDEEDVNEDEDDEDEEEDEEEEEDEDEDEEDGENEDEDEEEEEENDEEEEEDAEEKPVLFKPRQQTSSASVGSRSTSALASEKAALVNHASFGKLEATRILTPKDFARIKALQAKFGEKGLASASAKKIVSMLQGQMQEDDDNNDEDESDDPGEDRRMAHQKRKKRRRGGRNLGEAEEEDSLGNGQNDAGDGSNGGKKRKTDENDGESEHQLTMPGAFFTPAVVSMHASALESIEVGAKRKQAERLLDVLKAKKEGGKKFEGKKPDAGLTNREKERKKNFMMKSKSHSVQSKLRASLKAQYKAVKGRLEHKSQGRLTKMRRRRT
jgi:protein SDA1